jgi:hypothetical protein
MGRVPGALSRGIKRLGREADHSPPSSTETKEFVELYLHSQYALMAWCSVKNKAQGKLYLYLMDTPNKRSLSLNIGSVVVEDRLNAFPV